MKKTTPARDNGAMDAAVVEIAPEMCKGCGICVVICPRGCLERDPAAFNAQGFHPAGFSYRGTTGNCTACGLCYLVCPDYAVTAVKKIKK